MQVARTCFPNANWTVCFIDLLTTCIRISVVVQNYARLIDTPIRHALQHVYVMLRPKSVDLKYVTDLSMVLVEVDTVHFSF